MNITHPIDEDALYLALDQGGHASRALVFNGQGEPVAQAVQDIATTRNGDCIEHDAEELVASLIAAIASVAAQLGSATSQVVSAGLATQRSSIACWDKHSGVALSPIISWQDRRAATWLNRFAAHREPIQSITGLVMSPHYGASKLRWCLDHLPAVKEALAEGRLALGPLASFLAFRLCHERPLLCDPANAGRTLLWNIQHQNWDDSLLRLFGVPHSALPQCVQTRHDFGHIQLGKHHIPLQIVTGDQSAALFAQGPCQPDSAYVNVGTGAFVLRIAPHRIDTHGKLLSSIAYQDDSRIEYALEGTVNGAGSALSWLEASAGPLNIAAHGESWFTHPRTELLFLNGISGLGSPFWHANFPSQFLGTGTTGEKALAIMESVIFLLKTNLDEMAQHLQPPNNIVISGGFSALNGFCQRLTDLCDVPIYRPTLTEATAKGTACLLANLPNWRATGTGFYPYSDPTLHYTYQRWLEAMRLLV